MIITTFTVTAIGPNKIRIAWTGTVDFPSFIFINGVDDLDNPYNFGAVTARSIDVDVPDLFNIEIQEDAAGIVVSPTEIPFRRTPFFHWERVSTAVRYIVFRTPAGGSEEIVQFERDDPAVANYRIQSQKDLRGNGPLWNVVRIEAEDSFGNESTSATFPHYVKSVPEVPVTAIMTGTSPALVLTITT